MNSTIRRPSKEMIHVSACPHPFKVERKSFEIEKKISIQEILEQAQIDPVLRSHARIFINDRFIPKSLWDNTYPSPGDFVSVRVVPTGGGGGGKSPLRVVLLIAVVVASYYTGGAAAKAYGAAYGAAAGAATSIVGGLVVNAIAPPPTPKLAELTGTASGAGESPTLSITGARNATNLFGPVPRVLGKHRMFPPFGAKQVTEIVGDDQYLRILLLWGYGPLTITNLKIGETLITNFTDVEIETIEGDEVDQTLTLYPSDITETAVSVLLNEVDAGTVRTTEAGVDEISVDIAFLQGLVEYAGGGQKQDLTVDALVEYRVTSPVGSWQTAGTISTTARKSSVVRSGLRWQVPRDQYDVRIHRTTSDTSGTSIFDKVTWVNLRSIINEDPIVPTGLAKTAIRIKATAQLNGFLDTINGVCESRVNDWTGSAWTVQEARNPASLYREVLQGTGNARPLADSRVDLDTLQEWHDFCETKGFTFNGVIDYPTSVFAVLADIAAAGRASPANIDGKRSVVYDHEQTTPVQVFSNKNSWGFKGSKIFSDYPHGWRFRFVNEQQGYKNDERIVYFDGYTEGTATEFVGLEVQGVTNPDLIHIHGKYHEAVLKLRPESYSFQTDVENLVCKRGDLIYFNHDVPLFGVGSGRIKAMAVDGSGNITGLTMDDYFIMETGSDYNFRIRTKDGANILAPVDTVPGETNSFTLTTPISPSGELISERTDLMSSWGMVSEIGGSQINVGDLALFGLVGLESVAMLIKNIEPGENLTARITGVDLSPAIYTADQGTIPTFNSQITPPPSIDQPVITSIRSDANVSTISASGDPEIRALVSLGLVNLLDLDRIKSLEVRYRETGSAGPYFWTSSFEPDSREVSITGVEEGETYDFEFRYAYKNGDFSAWTIEAAHQITGIINSPRNEKLLGWPGTLVDCHVNPQSNLISDGNAAISTLPDTIAELADTIRDIVASKSPISYTTPTIDLGADVTVTPRLSVTADDGTVTKTMQVGTDADGAPTGSFVSLGSVTARYFKLRSSVAAGAVAARITEFLANLDTITKEENYQSINIATESGVFFERIAAGHFKIETKGEIESISIARVDAFIGAGGGFTTDTISVSTTLTARSVPAAEIKIYDSTGTLSDATVSISLIGARA